ncbi:hypothetical protein [Streptomyces marispadix]|uniref:Uncharacterized protein n=1 Tax=Streptomyces marispadix TaxID=2922868 RepID=A0ABS9SW88_9ACTN|nr:hypothetical protein [Streptomyces marispadix]MCH6160547.1 hypothetical protein [Streptomyces marispadix]
MATKKLLERVRDALPQNEDFIAAFESEPSSTSGNKPIAPAECRPSVFEGMAQPSDMYGTVFSLLYRIIANEVFPSSAPVYSDPAQREECKQKNRVFYGGGEATQDN